MKAYWVIPAGLSGVGIGLALGRRQELELAHNQVKVAPGHAEVRNLPQGGSVHVHFGKKPTDVHPPELTYECGWCKARLPLDEIGGVLIEHERLRDGERCGGSGRFPKL